MFQSTIASVFSSFGLQLDRTLRHGEWVEVGSQGPASRPRTGTRSSSANRSRGSSPPLPVRPRCCSCTVSARAEEKGGGDQVICDGINACKGQGHTKTTAADCKAKGGKVVEAKK